MRWHHLLLLLLVDVDVLCAGGVAVQGESSIDVVPVEVRIVVQVGLDAAVQVEPSTGVAAVGLVLVVPLEVELRSSTV